MNVVARIVAPSGVNYGGDGACLEVSIMLNPSVSQNQPTCNSNTMTGLIDCDYLGVSSNLEIRVGDPTADAVTIAPPVSTHAKWISPGWCPYNIELSLFIQMNNGSD
jgi:hypothetical protein